LLSREVDLPPQLAYQRRERPAVRRAHAQQTAAASPLVKAAAG
jgi:hypothetical protein